MTKYAQQVVRLSDLSQEMATYRLQGIVGDCPANQVTTIDWKFPEERWMSGGIFLTRLATWGSKVDVEVIDKDNVLGFGANVVLNLFTKDFYVANGDSQWSVECPYIALIPANIYLRVTYTNTSADVAAKVALNLFTHIPKA